MRLRRLLEVGALLRAGNACDDDTDRPRREAGAGLDDAHGRGNQGHDIVVVVVVPEPSDPGGIRGIGERQGSQRENRADHDADDDR